MTKKIPEYHGRDRIDCGCGICSGEDQYHANEGRKIKNWDRENISW